jgi:hypothetical protein
LKNCREIVRKWHNQGSTLQNDPLSNIDSNALFVIGSWIITNTGSAITANGKFKKPQGNPKIRRKARSNILMLD